MNKKTRKTILIIIAIILIIGELIYAEIGKSTEKTPNSIQYRSIENIPQEIIGAETEGIAAGKYILADVQYVIDGDTIKVKYNNELISVRLLNVDTPESVKSGVKLQPYGKEASEFTKKLVEGEQVKLIFDKDTEDRYDRLLAYVFNEKDEFVNALLVRNGFARVQIVEPNSTYEDYFYNLQNTAIQQKEGFWSLDESLRPFVADEYGEFVPSYQIAN